MTLQEQFLWECQPEAENLLLEQLGYSMQRNRFLKDLNTVLWNETSTKLFDWIDHIEIGYGQVTIGELESVGFAVQVATPLYRVLAHPRAKLPLIVVKDDVDFYISCAIGVESVADFLMVRGLSRWIEGSALSTFRRACICREEGVVVYAVERRGVLSMEPVTITAHELQKVIGAYEKWKTRPRAYTNPDMEAEGIANVVSLAEELVEIVGQGMAAHIVLDVERQFWQAKNRAAQLQKSRQDRFGLGWANHDHHTFRSSRKYFRSLVRLFEILGFHCRERFYAGAEAGWGAQVMEHSTARIVLFLDVDLAPVEVQIDFAHQPLQELDHLGTIGLWCALHGESILQAGMHHLEAQFSFEKLRDDLTSMGISIMEPFSHFTYLKQAFTQGELWSVNPERIEYLKKRAYITEEQAQMFLQKGAIGSHLENLERRYGYKGFNQQNVSTIIKKTDPRLSSTTGA